MTADTIRAERLLEAIGGIDDAFVQEAPVQTAGGGKKGIVWLTIAASMAIILTAVFTYGGGGGGRGSNSDGLPMLPVNEEFGPMGFEGYLAYDISELENGNPWRPGSELDTMPVFENPTGYDGAGLPTDGVLSVEEMTQMVLEAAASLGLVPDEIYTRPTEEEIEWQMKKGGEAQDPYMVVAVCGNVKIDAEADGSLAIWFEPGIPLPGEYSFTFYDTSREQGEEVLSYLLEEFKNITGMESPGLDLFGDYNIYGEYGFNFGAFENQGDLKQQILGYNFDTIGFSPDEEGKLWIIRRKKTDLSRKIGDYPIISADEAEKKLLAGEYITSVPEEVPGREYIARVELVYRTGRFDEVFMPYYKFLVELPDMERDNGLKNFGAYYVPAVEGEFLTLPEHIFN